MFNYKSLFIILSLINILRLVYGGSRGKNRCRFALLPYRSTMFALSFYVKKSQQSRRGLIEQRKLCFLPFPRAMERTRIFLSVLYKLFLFYLQSGPHLNTLKLLHLKAYKQTAYYVRFLEIITLTFA